ncbi:golgi-body localization protein domain-containing protein [Syncephalis plumigaleata]|nr:golgi-body localization protein domain-containing protein [Syncephalis plumigaleata]
MLYFLLLFTFCLVATLFGVKLLARWLLARFGCRVGRIGWLHLRDIELRVQSGHSDYETAMRLTIGTAGLRFTWQHLRWIHLVISDIQVAVDPVAIIETTTTHPSRSLFDISDQEATSAMENSTHYSRASNNNNNDRHRNERSSPPKYMTYVAWLAIRFSNWIGLIVEQIQFSMMGTTAPDITIQFDRIMLTSTIFQLGLRDGSEMLSFEGRVDLWGIALKTHLLPDMPPTSLTSVDAFSVSLSGKTRLDHVKVEQLELDVDLDKQGQIGYTTVTLIYALDENYPDTSPTINVSWRSFGALFILPRLSEVGMERNGLMDIQMTTCRVTLKDDTCYPSRHHTLASINDISARLSIDFVDTTLLRSRTSINVASPKLLLNTNILSFILSYRSTSPTTDTASVVVEADRDQSTTSSPSIITQLSTLPPFNVELRLNQPLLTLSNAPMDHADTTSIVDYSAITLCPDHIRLYGSLAPPPSTGLTRMANATLSQLAGGITIEESTMTVQTTDTGSTGSSIQSVDPSVCFTLPEAHLQWAIDPVLPVSPIWPQRSLSVHLDVVEIDLPSTSIMAIGSVMSSLTSALSSLASTSTTASTSTSSKKTRQSRNPPNIVIVFRMPSISIAIYGPGDPDDVESRGISLQWGNIELQVEHQMQPNTTEPVLMAKGALQSLSVHAFKSEVQPSPMLLRRRRSSVVRPLSSNATNTTSIEPLLLIETINFFTDSNGAHQPIICHIPHVNIHMTLLNLYALVTAIAHLTKLAPSSSSSSQSNVQSTENGKDTSTTSAQPATNNVNDTATPRFIIELMSLQLDWQLANNVDLTFKLRCIRSHYSTSWYTDIESCRMYGYTERKATRLKLLTLQSLVITPHQQHYQPTLPYHSIIISIGTASLSNGRCNREYQQHHQISQILLARVLTGAPPVHTDTHVDLPRLEIRIVELLFELLDSPFEMALARIFRLGVPEQRERLVRETIMETKLAGLETDTTQMELAVDAQLARHLLLEYNANRWMTKMRTSNSIANQPPLMRLTGRDVLIKLGPPSFGRDHLAEWVHTLDQCTPADYIYDLCILMHLSLSTSELLIQLRDLPNPIVHFPPPSSSTSNGNNNNNNGSMKSQGSAHHYEPSFVWEGDLALLEQYPLPCAFRYVSVPITDRVTAISARTISPVKIFTDAHISVRNRGETRICWGPCIQPTLAELSHVFDTLTDPNPDPSPALGWWDKLRLILHGRLRLGWPQSDKSGGLVVRLQGGQHPWEKNLRNAGLALVWRDGVSVTLGGEQHLLEFHSKEFLMAIPDSSLPSNERGSTKFTKTLLRLAGDVTIGLAMRLDKPDDIDDWVPHHEIVTRMSSFTTTPNHDSFRGYRAGKVHMQFVFEANQTSTSSTMNSVHLTPQATQHFLSFIELFGAEKSPPIRMGRLFPDVTSKPPNFGRHLASLRFTFALSPFTLGYFIRDETTTTAMSQPKQPLRRTRTATMATNASTDNDNDNNGKHEQGNESTTRSGNGSDPMNITLRGVKARVDRFDLELVMEQYEKTKAELPEHSMMKTGFGIQDVMVDVATLDARTIMVNQVEYDLSCHERLDMACMLEEIDLLDDDDNNHEDGEDMLHTQNEENQYEQEMEKLRVLEAWMDTDDLEDIDMPYISRIGSAKVTPFIFAPRTIYFKQGKSTSAINRLSMAGKDVRDIQLGIFEERRSTNCLLEELYQRTLPTASNERSHRRAELSRLKANLKIAAQQLTVVERHLAQLESNDEEGQQAPVFTRHTSGDSVSEHEEETSRPYDMMDNDKASQSGLDSFDHRWVVHNAHIIWNVEVRNQMFRYTRLLTRQHAIRYYMTATAVKAIRDTARKIMRNNERALSIDNSIMASSRQQRKRQRKRRYQEERHLSRDSMSEDEDDEDEDEDDDQSMDDSFYRRESEEYSPEDLIRQLLGDDAPPTYPTSPTTMTDANTLSQSDKVDTEQHNIDDDDDDDDHSSIHPTGLDDYEVDHSLLVMFTYPQVSFQSGQDNSTLVFLSAEQIQLESLSILDPFAENNTSNYLVKTRNILHIKDIQVFVAHRVHCMARSRSSLTLQYGSSRNKWQDWLPVDVLVDYDGESGPFQRVVSRASATLYHDKRNPLRFTAQSTSNDHISGNGAATATTVRSPTTPNSPSNNNNNHGSSNTTPWSMHTDNEYDGDQGETVTDMLFIHLPALVFSADALQFASIWSVANDLLAYREPDEHLDQINNILLASESNDYAVIVDTILDMQEKINGLRQVIERYLLDRHLLLDNNMMNDQYYGEDFARLIDQHRSMREALYVIVTTMIRAQQLRERRRQATKTVIRTVMNADRVVWLMVDDDSKDPLCECTLYHANLVWVMGDDQSSSNTLEIDRLEVIDRMPKAYFVELLYPLIPEGRTVDFTRRKMLRVHWRELAPVAGINVIEHFEVNLYPCIVRLTQEVGRRIMAYAFPEKQRLRLHQESMLHARRATTTTATTASGYPLIVTEETGSSLPTNDDSTGNTSLTGQMLREEPESLDDNNVASSNNGQLALNTHGITRQRTMTRRSTVMTNTGDDDALSTAGNSRQSRQRSRSVIRSATIIGNRQYRSLTQMRTRASENRTFIYVKVPSTQLCLSYRGRKEKDISNLNDFVFNLPTFEYRNKTCTSLELLLQVKKDIIWRLLSHTGSLVKGKLFNSRPKQQIASHLKSGALMNAPRRSSSMLRSDPNTTTTSNTANTTSNSSTDGTPNTNDELGASSSYSSAAFPDSMVMQRTRALLHVEPGTTMKKRPSMLLRALSTQSEEGTDKTESAEEGEPEIDEGSEGGARGLEEENDDEDSEMMKGTAMLRESSASSNPSSSSSLSVMGQGNSHMATSLRQSRSNDQKSRLLFGKLYHAQND